MKISLADFGLNADNDLITFMNSQLDTNHL